MSEEGSVRKKLKVDRDNGSNHDTRCEPKPRLTSDAPKNAYSLQVTLRTDKPFPRYGQPKQIGYFCVDGNREYTAGKAYMKYYYPPPDPKSVYYDLNIGYAGTIKKEFGLNERIDFLLKWVIENKSLLTNVEFVNYRGLLTKVMLTPYERQDDWIICATKYRGVIYLCSFNTERDHKRHAEQTERDKLMSSWGYKFEQYLMSDTPGEPPNTDVPVNEREEYDCVVKTHINRHSLLFSAEIDGLDANTKPDYPEKTGNTDRYIELKTSRVIEFDRQQRNFNVYKLKKFWAQSFLIGIPKIFCGFRDDNGVVLSVDLFRTRAIPKMALGMWSASGCMNFLDEFLTFIKKCVTEDHPRCVYKFEWKPGGPIEGVKLYNSTEFQILPDWYIQSF